MESPGPRGSCWCFPLSVEPAPAVAGGSSVLPTFSFPDLVRLFLSLSGPVDQRGAVLGSLLSAAGVTGAGGLPAPAAPVTSAAPVACSSAVPTPGASTPAGAASATASPDRCERAREYLPAQRGTAGGRLVGRGPVRVGSVAGVVPFPCSLCPFGQCVCLLEAVQARVMKLIPSIRHLGYVRRLERLNLCLLEKCRLRGQLIETFKMLKGMNHIEPYQIKWVEIGTKKV